MPPIDQTGNDQQTQNPAHTPPQGEPAQHQAPAPPTEPPQDAAPPADTPPPSDPATQQSSGEKPVMLPQSAFKRIKKEFREKGKREGLIELAKAYGFSSPEELEGMLKGFQAAGGKLPDSVSDALDDQDPDAGLDDAAGENGDGSDGDSADASAQTPPKKGKGKGKDRQTGSNSKSFERFQMKYDKLAKEKEQIQNQLRREVSKRREVQQRLDAREAEIALERTAHQAGVHDTDYAIRLLTRHLEGLSEENLAKFDELEFFSSLREKHPYLFGEVTRPATTGHGGNGSPATPKPGDAAKSAAQGGKTDARKMNPQEFSDLLRKRGLNPSA